MIENVSILVNISTSYIDIAALFDELMIKNWKDCPYPIYYLCDSRPSIDLHGEIIINELQMNPLKKLISAAEKINSFYYICLLGDAFISDKVSNEEVSNFINTMRDMQINYCNLYRNHYKKTDVLFSNITKSELYGFAFVEFIASKEFLKNVLSRFNSDLEFENYYNEKSMKGKNKECYEDCVRANLNLLNILHGIQKGKWVRDTKKKIDKISDLAVKNKRPIMSRTDCFYNELFDILLNGRIYKIYKKIKGKL